MYRLICFFIVFVFCSQSVIAQKRNRLKSTIFNFSLNADLLFLPQSEFSLQIEKGIFRDISILGSIGFKKHKLPAYSNLHEYKNSFVNRETRKTTWIVFIPLSETTNEYLNGTHPLENLGDFILKTSFPFKLNFRYYVRNKESNLKFFCSLGLAANYHTGYAVSDKTSLIYEEEEASGFTGIFFIAGESTTATTSYYEQIRTMIPNESVTFGVNTEIGLRYWLTNHFSLILNMEVGNNLLNTNSSLDYYGIQHEYFINGHLSLAYSF